MMRRSWIVAIPLLVVLSVHSAAYAAAPSAPTGLSPHLPVPPYPQPVQWVPAARARVQVQLAWQPVAGATSYAVRADDLTVPSLRDPRNNCGGDPHFLCINAVAGSPLIFTARAGHEYRWWVHAINAEGWSPASVATFRVGEPPVDDNWSSGPLRVFPIVPAYREIVHDVPPVWRAELKLDRAFDPNWTGKSLTVRCELRNATDQVLTDGTATFTSTSNTTFIEVSPPALAAGRYRLRFILYGPAGAQRDEHSFEYRVADREPAVRLENGQRLRRFGVPMFPLGVYMAGHDSDGDFARLASSGFNTAMSYQFGFYAYGTGNEATAVDLARQFVERARRNGMGVLFGLKDFYQDGHHFPEPARRTGLELATEYVRAVKDSPAIVGWYTADEPNLVGAGFSAYRRMPKLEAMQQLLFDLDPDHPTWLVFLGGADEAFFPSTDILSVDYYPIPDHSLASTFGAARSGVLAGHGAKPAWFVPQVHRTGVYTNDPAQREPTLAEKRSMIFQALTAGVNGLILYSHFDQFRDVFVNPDGTSYVGPAEPATLERRLGELSHLAANVTTLAPALLAGTTRGLPAQTATSLRVRAVEHGGALWVMAANAGDAAVTTPFTLPAGEWGAVDAPHGEISGQRSGSTLTVTVPQRSGGYLRVERAGVRGSRWSLLQGGARDVGVGPDGTAWRIGTAAVGGGFAIQRFNGTTWDTIPGGAVRISVGPAGPWLVNNGGTVYRRDGNLWIPVGGGATDIGVASTGEAWIVTNAAVTGGFSIARWNGREWQPFEGGGVRIAVAPGGVPWLVNNAGQIFRHDGMRWVLLPGAASDIGVGADGTVWIIGRDPVYGGFGIYRWSGTQWQRIDGGATNVAVGPDGLPWVTNDLLSIYRRLR